MSAFVWNGTLNILIYFKRQFLIFPSVLLKIRRNPLYCQGLHWNRQVDKSDIITNLWSTHAPIPHRGQVVLN